MHNYEHLQNRLRHKEIVLMDGAMGTVRSTFHRRDRRRLRNNPGVYREIAAIVLDQCQGDKSDGDSHEMQAYQVYFTPNPSPPAA